MHLEANSFGKKLCRVAWYSMSCPGILYNMNKGLGMQLSWQNACLSCLKPEFHLQHLQFYREWWYTPVIPAVGRRQEDQKFKDFLSCIGNPRLPWTVETLCMGLGRVRGNADTIILGYRSPAPKLQRWETWLLIQGNQ